MKRRELGVHYGTGESVKEVMASMKECKGTQTCQWRGQKLNQ